MRPDSRRTDTREQIRGVALDLFAERGYDATSLREIAERLGVTKAAVYYHFRTKEEILASLFDEQLAGIDAIIEWARAQEPGVERRRGIVQRYAALRTGESGEQFGRLIQAQQALKEFAPGKEMHRRLDQLCEFLGDPGDSPDEWLRARLALFAVHLGEFAPALAGSLDERRAAALRVALELVAGR
jgi:AcrR family transcriptional regulator